MSIRKSAIIEKAQKLVLKGKINEAIEEWEKLAAETPNDGNIYNSIGDLYLKANKKANATVAYIKAGEAFHSAAFELKSIALYKKALKVDPSRYEVYEKLASVYAERGLIGNAIDDYLKAAKHYADHDELSAALTIYQKLSELDPNNVKTWLEIGEICLKQEKNDEALEAYKKAFSIYETKNKTEDAEKIRNIIIKLEPEFGQVETEEMPDEKGIEESIETAEPSEPPTGVDHNSIEPSPEVKHPEPESSGDAEEEMAGFIAPESEPMAEEQTYFQSDYSVMDFQDVGDMASEEEPKGNALENAMTEVEVYIQYGLFDKAIDQILDVTKSFPQEAVLFLKLKEIYTQQGMTEKAIDVCRTLMDIYEEQGEASALEKIREEITELLPQNRKTPQATDPVHLEETQVSESLGQSAEASQSSERTLTAGELPEVETFGEELSIENSFTENPSEPTIVGLDEVSNRGTTERQAEENKIFDHQNEAAVNENVSKEADAEEYVDLNEILSESFSSEEDEFEPSDKESLKKQEDIQQDRKEQEAETQYDLGIAYKEMDMMSEAMNAFELAAVGERFEGAMIMLAFCHRDEGSISSAITVLEKALSDPKHKEENMIALKYELALLYEQTGDEKFSFIVKEIYESDPTFREISSKYQNTLLQKN